MEGFLAEGKPVYSYFIAYRQVRPLPTGPNRAWEELSSAVSKLEGRCVLRAAYRCQGFRPDTDVMFWWLCDSMETVHDAYQLVRRTGLGSVLEASHAFLGVVRPPEFNPDHRPSFLKGESPKRYICVYPFVRTAEWYLMEPDRRAALLREHGELGRQFPEVRTNTTSGFGLGDWEWILAFESDDMIGIVDCIRKLREAEARRYTKLDTPFVVGIHSDLEQVVESLG
jgi:peroxiredoxin